MPKIKNLKELSEIRNKLKLEGKKVVFTNGCFDLIHRGHIHLFREAKKLADVLIVAVNDDSSVRRLKGEMRPIFSLEERLEILEAIEDIDYLVPFAEDTPHKIISVLLPDLLVKGGDWRVDEVVGREEVEEAGGKVVIIPYLKGNSSSLLIQKILRAGLALRKDRKMRSRHRA